MADDGNTLVTQGTSHVQGHSKPHFSCAILVLWGCFINSMILQVFSNQNYSWFCLGRSSGKREGSPASLRVALPSAG